MVQLESESFLFQLDILVSAGSAEDVLDCLHLEGLQYFAGMCTLLINFLNWGGPSTPYKWNLYIECNFQLGISVDKHFKFWLEEYFFCYKNPLS